MSITLSGWMMVFAVLCMVIVTIVVSYSLIDNVFDRLSLYKYRWRTRRESTAFYRKAGDIARSHNCAGVGCTLEECVRGIFRQSHSLLLDIQDGKASVWDVKRKWEGLMQSVHTLSIHIGRMEKEKKQK